MEKNHDPIRAMLDLVTRHALGLSQFVPRGNPQGLEAALAVVGYLIDGKNKYTNESKDIYFLTEETTEGQRFSGILGANLHIQDTCGTPLHIGDTVLLLDNHMEIESPVLESFRVQTVEEMGAVKKQDFTEALQSGFLEDCDFTVHSCLDAFRESPLYQSATSEEAQEDSSCPQL